MTQEDLNSLDFNVKSLGKCHVPSPLHLSKVIGDEVYDYVNESERILYDGSTKALERSRRPDAYRFRLKKPVRGSSFILSPTRQKSQSLRRAVSVRGLTT